MAARSKLVSAKFVSNAVPANIFAAIIALPGRTRIPRGIGTMMLDVPPIVSSGVSAPAVQVAFFTTSPGGSILHISSASLTYSPGSVPEGATHYVVYYTAAAAVAAYNVAVWSE